MNYQPKAISEKKKYHEDLSQLADERMRYRQLNRLKDNQEGMLVRVNSVKKLYLMILCFNSLVSWYSWKMLVQLYFNFEFPNAIHLLSESSLILLFFFLLIFLKLNYQKLYCFMTLCCCDSSRMKITMKVTSITVSCRLLYITAKAKLNLL